MYRNLHTQAFPLPTYAFRLPDRLQTTSLSFENVSKGKASVYNLLDLCAGFARRLIMLVAASVFGVRLMVDCSWMLNRRC
jgi:hypothetical protein